MSISSVSLSPAYSLLARSLTVDRMSAQRASSATAQNGEPNSVAAINTPQFFADKANRVSALEESAGGVSTTDKSQQSGSEKSPKPAFDPDADKPQSASGDVLDLSDKAKTANSSELTTEQQQQVTELKARDAEVRTHEAAHIAAAGQYASGGASFTYQTGPDGNKYAIGGEVSIDSSAVKGDPEATLRKAQQVRAAALAPASPSSQDQKVAAAASQQIASAQAEIARKKTQEMKEMGSSESDSEPKVQSPSELKTEENKAATKGPMELAEESENESSATALSTSKLSTPQRQYRSQSLLPNNAAVSSENAPRFQAVC